MFKHEKQLFHPVEIERPNPQYAVLLQEQLGGGNGELKAAMQYMSQSFRVKDPEIKDLFLDIAAEELGHMEMVAQTINLLNGHEVDCSNQIATLESKLESLKKSTPADVITAPNSGYYVSRPDGFENVLTIDDLDKLTSEKLSSAFKSEREKISSDSIGKIINGFNWYIATEVDASGVSSLKSGKSVKPGSAHRTRYLLV